MFNLSENYHLRKCFLQREQVPTQRMMIDKMSPALAAIYFNSMSPKLKVLAGLEPKLKGGGNNWYVPPEALLEGRSVLKPIKKEAISKLNHLGIDTLGRNLFDKHRKSMDLEIEQALIDSDNNWKHTVTATTHHLWDDLVAAATKKNTKRIVGYFDDFSYLYRQSIGKIEILFHESAITEIKSTRENSIQEMQHKYATSLKHQAALIHDKYEKKLMEELNRLKIDFMEKLEISRTTMADRIHDLKVDKYMAIEKLRQCLHCQNLACVVYVALQERDNCLKEIEELKHKHQQKVKIITKTIQTKDFEIHLADEKEKKRRELCNIWRKKVCHVVKMFQKFVSYCLKMLPEHAEFFINMEKLMFLQVDQFLEDPSAASIIEVEQEQFHEPVPRPKPFYMFCDRGYKAELKEDLCPRHSGTSSASGIPVMVINKRCLYAACDNFEQFTNKIKEFIHGNRGDAADFRDDLVYEHLVPVKYASSQQLVELKLESSLLKVLQQEMAYMQTVPIKCEYCGLPWCLPCSSRQPSTSVDGDTKIIHALSSATPSRASSLKLNSISRSMELDHEREPKWDSFYKHVQPKTCSCAKTSKKHLAEHVPVYMRRMRYGPPEIPGYKICSTKELKTLVREARKEIPPPPVPVAVPSRTNDMSTQCYDLEFETLCTCYSDDELKKLIDNIKYTADPKKDIVAMSPSFMKEPVISFATSRVRSLRNLVENVSELEYIFKRDNCDFE